MTKEITFKVYRRHALKEELQYLIQSDKTDHLATHKGRPSRKSPNVWSDSVPRVHPSGGKVPHD